MDKVEAAVSVDDPSPSSLHVWAQNSIVTCKRTRRCTTCVAAWQSCTTGPSVFTPSSIFKHLKLKLKLNGHPLDINSIQHWYCTYEQQTAAHLSFEHHLKMKKLFRLNKYCEIVSLLQNSLAYIFYWVFYIRAKKLIYQEGNKWFYNYGRKWAKLLRELILKELFSEKQIAFYFIFFAKDCEFLELLFFLKQNYWSQCINQRIWPSVKISPKCCP